MSSSASFDGCMGAYTSEYREINVPSEQYVIIMTEQWIFKALRWHSMYDMKSTQVWEVV